MTRPARHWTLCGLALTAVVLVSSACKSKPRTDAPTDAANTTIAAQPDDERVPSSRLPPDVTPLAYDLDLTVVPSEPKFAGRVVIEVQLSKPRRVVWLHARDLRVTRAEVRAQGERLFVLYTQRDEEGVASLTLPRAIGPGVAKLELSFEAPFNTNDVALYRTDAGGESYAFTQFEAIDARRAFPCFDEPAFKTPFRISVEVKREHVAVSNAPLVGEEHVTEQRKRLRFAPTENLPTYLVALAVGSLDVVDAPPVPPSALRPKPLPLRGVASKGKGEQLKHALSLAPELVARLERYFGTAYPYAKLDLLAVPGMAGAMENAGAVTFEENILLVTPETYTGNQARRLISTLTHELAHQWFGNLVTMRWWDDLWLNEAFASWLETRIYETWKPHHRAWLRQWTDVANAMRVDGLTAARRIRQPIASNHDIHGAFDDITYGKGARVLSMFERYLGGDVFARGVQVYLKRHRFGSATTDDFFDALSTAAGRPVGPALRTFLDQSGVPLVEVRKVCEGGAAKAHLRQSRFLPRGSKGDRNARWQLPVCLRYPGNKGELTTCTLLRDAESEVPLPGVSCPAWVHPNADGAGYYHFVLSKDETRALVLASSRLTPRENMSVVASLEAAFETGALDAGFVLAQLPVFAASPHRGVARSPMELLRRTGDDVVPASHAAKFQAWARALYRPAMSRLGFEARGAAEDEERLLRVDIVGFLVGAVRDPAVRAEATRRAATWLGGLAQPPAGGKAKRTLAEGQLDPALLESALEAAADDGDDALFGALIKALGAQTDTAVRRRIVRALARATTPKRAERVRALALDKTVTANEVIHLLREHTAVKANVAPTFEWLKSNYAAVVARLPRSSNSTAELPRLFEGLCSTEAATLLRAFLGPRVQTLPGAPRNLDIAEERITLCAAIAGMQRASAMRFFK